jgi:carbon monoxide dehydrogenase subunit G
MNKTLAITALVAVVVLLTPAAGRAADDTVELKLNLEKGREYKLVITTEQSIVQWIMETEMEMDQTVVLGETFKVTDVAEDGTYTIEVKIGPVAMKMESQMMSFEFDSEDPPDEIPMAARGMAAFVDQVFTVKMTPRGKVVELSGTDKLFESMKDAFEGVDEQTRDRMIEDMKKQFGGDGLKEMMETFTAIYPDKPVGVGDSWEQKSVMSRVFPLIANVTYTLAERKDGVASLKVDGTFEPNPKGEPTKMGDMTMKIALKGTQEGTLQIDETTGWFVAGEMTQEMEGEVTASGVPGVGEMSLPMRIKGTVSFKTE